MGAIKQANTVLEIHQHIATDMIAPLHDQAIDMLEGITSLAEHQKAALRQMRKIIDGPLQNAEKLDEIDDLLRGWKM